MTAQILAFTTPRPFPIERGQILSLVESIADGDVQFADWLTDLDLAMRLCGESLMSLEAINLPRLYEDGADLRRALEVAADTLPSVAKGLHAADGPALITA